MERVRGPKFNGKLSALSGLERGCCDDEVLIDENGCAAAKSGERREKERRTFQSHLG